MTAVSYPVIVEYNEAVQYPKATFTDPRLQSGQVATTPLGLPLALSGGFALTYTISSAGKKYAVRCFHRQIPSAEQKYEAISKVLRSLGSPYFVDFTFQPQGILVKGKRFPIVVMDWVEGKTLQVFLNDHHRDKQKIRQLQAQFRELAKTLESKNIAHGDISNDNVMVSPSGIRLIDYDGMYVPGMAIGSGSETGNRYFQHPARSTAHFGPSIDRFSFIAIDVSLSALLIDSNLYQRFGDGGNTIVFKANDFSDPSSSEIFKILRTDPHTAPSAEAFAKICSSDIVNVPTISDFLSQRNIPSPVSAATTKASGPTAPAKVYLGAYPVVDGNQFSNVLNHVGDKVELISQVVEVKQGVGRRGRSYGKPYVFINFTPWRGNNVKLTIWSEALLTFQSKPDAALVGKWISVVGLVDPPYEGKGYQSVGITIDNGNQVHILDAQEADFRLKKFQGVSRSRNESVIAGLGPTLKTDTSSKPPIRTSTASKSKSRNRDILDTIQGTQQSGQTTSSPPPTAGRSGSQAGGVPNIPSNQTSPGIPGWVVALGIALLMLMIILSNQSKDDQTPKPAPNTNSEALERPDPIQPDPVQPTQQKQAEAQSEINSDPKLSEVSPPTKDEARVDNSRAQTSSNDEPQLPDARRSGNTSQEQKIDLDLPSREVGEPPGGLDDIPPPIDLNPERPSSDLPDAFTTLDAIDFLGGNLQAPMRGVRVVSVCEAACASANNCIAFTFDKRRSLCLLKSKPSRAYVKKGSMSGYRVGLDVKFTYAALTLSESIDFPGNDYSSLEETSLALCANQCEVQEKCRAFSFIDAQRVCWLKTKAGGGKAKNGVVSGKKR